MNRKQLIAFWTGLVVVAGMALFPPHRVPASEDAGTAPAAQAEDATAYGFVLLAARETIAWERVRRRGLVVLLVTYAFLALLRTRPRGGGSSQDDDEDGRDDLPPPPEPHPAGPRRELAAA